jgi:CHAD domain-containing protein
VAYSLDPGESLGDGLRRVVVERARAAAAHLREEEEPARAVHEARKRSKEARAALRLLRGSLGAEADRAARDALRSAARRLAPARDAEATAATLEKLRHAQRLLRRERLPAEEALAARRRAAAERLTAGFRDEVAAVFEGAAAALPEVAYAGGDAVEGALARLYRRGRRAMRAARTSGGEDDYHRWRHDAKDLWYAVRLFEAAWPGPLAALAEELRSLSLLLGEEHDLTVLRTTLAATEPPLLTSRLARAIARRQRRLRQEAQGAGERLWAERPQAFAARIRTYWTSDARGPGR